MIFPIPAQLMEYLILGYLEKQDSYGYEICQSIKHIQNIGEPKMYPILKKLLEEGSISCYEIRLGRRRRKYYSLLPAGAEYLAQMKKDWAEYVAGVNEIVPLEPQEEPERSSNEQ